MSSKTKKPIHIIVACAENRVIAANGSIPWRIKEDFKHLYQSVKGGVVIEGRKCYNDIGKAYPETQTIVLSRDQSITFPDARKASSFQEALDIAHSIKGYPTIWIGGGQGIYEEAIAQTDRLYLTLVHKEVEGDTFFPEWRKDFTKVISKRRSSNAKYEYTFYILERENTAE